MINNNKSRSINQELKKTKEAAVLNVRSAWQIEWESKGCLVGTCRSARLAENIWSTDSNSSALFAGKAITRFTMWREFQTKGCLLILLPNWKQKLICSYYYWFHRLRNIFAALSKFCKMSSFSKHHAELWAAYAEKALPK